MRPPDDTIETQWLLAPCVYAWKRGARYLYVGLGAKGLQRPFGRHHVLNRRERFALEDVIEIWRFERAEEAVEFEKHLIRELRPKYNQPPQGKHRAFCGQCDRGWLSNVEKPLRCKFCKAEMVTNGISHYEFHKAESIDLIQTVEWIKA